MQELFNSLYCIIMGLWNTNVTHTSIMEDFALIQTVIFSLRRYWAVTNVDYIHTRNGRRIVGMIFVVWCVALVVSLAPQFGWKDPDYLDRINIQQRCMVSQDIGYQIFATCSTFYVPLLVILFLYWKIFKIARRRIRRRRAQRNAMLEHSRLDLMFLYNIRAGL